MASNFNTVIFIKSDKTLLTKIAHQLRRMMYRLSFFTHFAQKKGKRTKNGEATSRLSSNGDSLRMRQSYLDIQNPWKSLLFVQKKAYRYFGKIIVSSQFQFSVSFSEENTIYFFYRH